MFLSCASVSPRIRMRMKPRVKRWILLLYNLTQVLFYTCILIVVLLNYRGVAGMTSKSIELCLRQSINDITQEKTAICGTQTHPPNPMGL